VQPKHAPDIAPRGRTTRPSSNELLAVADRHWPQPQLRTRGRRAGQRWVVGCARWPGPGHAARRSPSPAGAPAVTGPLAQRRQRPRRRITPNTNTSTTTMISTHNHVDTAASLVGAGQFAVTLLSPTRASNSVTARRPPGPGSTAVLRAGSRGPCTPRPTRRSGLAGCGPARPGRRPRVSPGGPSPSATPSQPSPNRIDQHHKRGGPGRRHPTRRDHSDPDRRSMARPGRVCLLGWGTIRAWLCDAQWQMRAAGARPGGARLRRNPNLRQ
jgi:hypothetical protein